MKKTRPPANNKAMAPTPRNSLGSSRREAPVAVCAACPSGNFVNPSAVADASTSVAPAAEAGVTDVACTSDEDGVVTKEVFEVVAG